MTEADVQKLKSAGIDDAIILEMQKEEAGKKGQAAPAADVAPALPEIDPNTPSTVYQQAQAAGVPTEGREQTWGQTATEVGGVLADNAGKIGAGALGAGGVYGAYKVGNWAKNLGDAYKTGVATNAATQEMRVLERLARGAGPEAEAAAQRLQQILQSRAPAVPTAPVTPAPVAPPAVAPSAPAAPVARAAEQGIMNRATDIVKRLALDKVLPMASNIAKGANAAALMTYSPELGPKVPGTGRMRGMEINPLTGAPWTPEQIAQYEANPAVYDQQLPPPQFRR
jgi:hypothetical protein